MGWNDRLPEDPFTPSSDYYQEQDRYEEWLEYITTCGAENENMFGSQNIDPAQLPRKNSQEAPTRQGILARLWANFFGQQDHKENKKADTNQEQSLPF